MKSISTQSAPVARGHYSQAIVHGGLVYVAGQLPIVPGEPDRQLVSFDDQEIRLDKDVAWKDVPK